MLTAQQIIDRLQLEPLTIEGGYFRETYRSKLTVPGAALPAEFSGERNVATAIYYLLTPEAFSAMHRVRSDEVFHFYSGDPVEMLQLRPDGSGETITINNDLAAGHVPQVVVPGGVWQGCRLAPVDDDGVSPHLRKSRQARHGRRDEKGDSPQPCHWALLGCTVAPGFDYADFEAGERSELIAAYPQFAEMIAALTA